MVLDEFSFGLFYAWTLCVFAVISTYSIICPMITPFGLVYLVLKYLVDRYNLYFVYLPSRIDTRIHWVAGLLALTSVFLLQVNLTIFLLLRRGLTTSRLSQAAVGLLVIGLVVLILAGLASWYWGVDSPRHRLARQRRHQLTKQNELQAQPNISRLEFDSEEMRRKGSSAAPESEMNLEGHRQMKSAKWVDATDSSQNDQSEQLVIGLQTALASENQSLDTSSSGRRPSNFDSPLGRSEEINSLRAPILPEQGLRHSEFLAPVLRSHSLWYERSVQDDKETIANARATLRFGRSVSQYSNKREELLQLTPASPTSASTSQSPVNHAVCNALCPSTSSEESAVLDQKD